MPAFNKIALMAACVSLPLISGCETKRIATAIPIPPDRMDCVEAGDRPAIPPEYKIDWARVEQAPDVITAARNARSEVAQFIGSVRTREGTVAGYVLMIEQHLFACSNDAQWLREWQAGISD